MSFYMRVGTDWDGIWYKEDRSLPSLLWHRHRLMGWSQVPKPACVHFLTTSLCIPLSFLLVYLILVVYVYVCICMYMYVYLIVNFFYVRILVSGAGIDGSSWIQFSHVQERPWTLLLKMVMILFLCAPHYKDGDVYTSGKW